MDMPSRQINMLGGAQDFKCPRIRRASFSISSVFLTELTGMV
jgi:hypothetical protein